LKGPQNPHDWQRAATLAARLHRHQLRKDGETPYAAHPFRVALTVQLTFGASDPATVCAALLHDAIEDTTADHDEILAAVGRDAADAVAALTKDMRLPEELREEAYDAQLAAASWRARLVKLADAYDNLCDASAPGLREKALAKAKRAAALAGDDPRLSAAEAALRRLIAECE